MKKFFIALAILVFGFVLGSVFSGNSKAPVSLVAFPESEIKERYKNEYDGNTYVVIGGDYYQDHGEGNYSYVQAYYDPDFYEKNYTTEDGAIFVESPGDSPTQVRLRNEFSESFETYTSIHDLIINEEKLAGTETIVGGITRYDVINWPSRWLSFTLQSPSAPDVPEYVAMRKTILEDGGDFIDNRIDISTDRVREGSKSARFYSIPPSGDMTVSKTALGSDTFHFKKGDDFWFSGWFYFEEGMPVTIMDLESTWLEGYSGIRILFAERHPYIELKALGKPSWKNAEYTVPVNEWVFVKAHFVLDEKDGQVELWINDELVVEGRGKTLPLADTVLNSFELGISATLEETVLFVDDVRVSESPL